MAILKKHASYRNVYDRLKSEKSHFNQRKILLKQEFSMG